MFLAAGGHMGERMRARRWAQSPLGMPEAWPQGLRVAVGIMLSSPHPVFIVCGPELLVLYNDACIPIAGERHPEALGQPLAKVCPADGAEVVALVRSALNGQPACAENLCMNTQRHGHVEQSWFTLSCSPLRDDDGTVLGVFCTCLETTSAMVAQQRVQFQLRLGERLSELSDVEDIRRVAAQELARGLNVAQVGYAVNAADFVRPPRPEQERAVLEQPIDWHTFGPHLLADLEAGTSLRVYDWSTDLRTSRNAGPFPAVGVMLVPLIQQAKLISVLYVCAHGPRHWNDMELVLAEDVALRTRLASQRARAVQARRAAEDALKQQLLSEANRLRELFALAPSFMAVLRGPEHVFELTNDALTRLVGRSELIGKAIRTALPELEGQRLFELLDEVYASGAPRVAEEWPIRVAHSAPELRFVSFVYQPLFASDGTTQGVFVIGHDITAQRRAHEALREQDARLRLALRAARMAEITIHYPDGKVTHSPSCAELFGYPADEQLTLEHLRARYHPGDALGIHRARDELWKSHNDFLATTHRVVWPDGTTRWLAVRGKLERAADGKPESITAVYIDITQQQRALQALQQSEAQFRVFAQAMPNLVWATNAAGEVEWMNDRFYEYMGVDPQQSPPMHRLDVIHPDELSPVTERWTAAMASGTVFESEMRVKNLHGEYRWFIARALPMVDEQGKVTRWIGSGTDIHDQKVVAAELATLNATLESRVEERSRELRLAEQALRHAQKMEAVGQLTGGIAHDFNNLLTGIIGSLEIMQRRMASGRMDDTERFMNAALSSANRAAALTQRLLAFSRQQQLDAKPLQLNDLVRSLNELLGRTMTENISLHLDLHPQLWLTEADRNQLESALLNITINARDAMPSGGRVTISTSNLHLQAEEASRYRELPPGDFVLLRVSDTGTGMSPEVLERAFDPFFTTKPVGQGTGLGLSMIYGFAKQSRGHVRLESELGCGTTLCLYLPRYEGDLPATEAPSGVELPRAQAGESVLIVEDDAAVRMLVVDVLEELGYCFIEAADSTAALPLLQSNAGLDLLITDVGLPGMNGRELAQLARKHRPDLKVLFITGYAEYAPGLLEPGMQLVKKPFALEALARKIREMLRQNS